MNLLKCHTKIYLFFLESVNLIFFDRVTDKIFETQSSKNRTAITRKVNGVKSSKMKNKKTL